jgi:glycosyltransferase involved in cell wall biosynthesis
MSDTIYIIIPAYNEETTINEIVVKLKRHFKFILVVNDGSTDRTRSILEELDVILINHSINLGQGGAIKTGIDYILKYTNADAIITFDADGQHSIEDAINFSKNILKTEKEIIFGSRFLGYEKNIPFIKILLLRTAIFLTNLLFSTKLTDTHNGLKAIKRNALTKLDISIEGFAFETEIVMDVSKNKISYMELPTNIVYTDYSKAKGQSIFNSIRIFEDVISKLFRK